VRPIHNVVDLKCPPPVFFNHKRWCALPCHKFPKFACADKTAHSLYDWSIYYLEGKDYVQCAADMTRHTAEFVTALQKPDPARPTTFYSLLLLVDNDKNNL